MLDQSPVSGQKVICCNSWECMNLTAISAPVLLHGPRRAGITSVWLRAYLRNCATLATKAPAPGCSTFPECKDTIPVNWLHSPHRHWRDVPITQHQIRAPAPTGQGENPMLHPNPLQPHETCEHPTQLNRPGVSPGRSCHALTHSPTQMSPSSSGRRLTSWSTAVITADSSSSGVVS